MTREEELLLEQVVSAHRERRPDGSIRSHPAWHDLSAELRVQAHDEALAQRQLEAALDPLGHSGTVKAVLARLPRR